MFDFSTETILNDLSRVSVLAQAQDPTLGASEKALYIKKLNKFKKNEVSAIYKTVATNPVNEVAHVSLPASVTGLANGHFRLSINVQLSGSENGDYSRWAVYKGKPFDVEALVGSADPANIDALGNDLAAKFARGFRKLGDVAITYNATSDKIEIAATNEFQRIKATLEKFDKEIGDFVKVADSTIKTAGAQGVGTSNYILKNLRLPTFENVRHVGENMDERPVANSLYDQYSFRLSAQRNFTGQGAVGQKIESITTHTLFVLRSQASAFEALITEAFGAGSIVLAKTNVAVNGA